MTSESEAGERAATTTAASRSRRKKAALDADGKLTDPIPTTVSGNKIDYRYRIEARVTDAAGREISGTGWIVATYGSFLSTCQPDRTISIAPAARSRVHGRSPRLRQPRPVHARPCRIARGTIAATTSSRAMRGRHGRHDRRRRRGHGRHRRCPRRAASYRVRVSAHTPEGRDVENSTYIWVSGAGEPVAISERAAHRSDHSGQEELSAGETAQSLDRHRPAEHACAGSRSKGVTCAPPN